MSNYFLSQPLSFGPISWLWLLAWGLTLAAGLYLYTSWQERNVLRARFMRQLGLVLSILAGTGIVLLALKGLRVPVLSFRIWGYLVALATIGYGVWAGITYQRISQAVAASSRNVAVTRRGSQQSGRGARTYTTNGTNGATEPRPIPTPRPVATTGRREARRDKKRKTR